MRLYDYSEDESEVPVHDQDTPSVQSVYHEINEDIGEKSVSDVTSENKKKRKHDEIHAYLEEESEVLIDDQETPSEQSVHCEINEDVGEKSVSDVTLQKEKKGKYDERHTFLQEESEVPVHDQETTSVHREVNEDIGEENFRDVTLESKKKRKYDERHACYFCQKLVHKISKHLLNVHKNEMEVQKILALEKKAKIELMK